MAKKKLNLNVTSTNTNQKPTQATLSKVAKSFSEEELAILLEYKKQKPGKGMGHYGWALNYAKKAVGRS